MHYPCIIPLLYIYILCKILRYNLKKCMGFLNCDGRVNLRKKEFEECGFFYPASHVGDRVTELWCNYATLNVMMIF